jgi:hypothetical protein
VFLGQHRRETSSEAHTSSRTAKMIHLYFFANFAHGTEAKDAIRLLLEYTDFHHQPRRIRTPTTPPHGP